MLKTFERMGQKVLSPAGLTIDGPNAYDLQFKVHGSERTRVLLRMLVQRSLGLAETYIEGKWECDDLIEFFERLLLLSSQNERGAKELTIRIQDTLINRQTKWRSKQVGERHYDIPPELFLGDAMLGTSGLYTCAYFIDGNKDLTTAQSAKVDLLIRKLKLQPEMTILDIGCGWGGMAKMLIDRVPDINYIGISISKEQIEICKEKVGDNPRVKFHLMDYRDIPSSWQVDRVISLGMIEHVGHKNLRSLFAKIEAALKPGGMVLAHFMHGLWPEPNDPFLDKYVFPNSELPTLEHVHQAIDSLFVIQDYHEIGRHYAPTLAAWDANFRKYWEKLSDEKKADVYGVLFPDFWKDLPINAKTPEETRLTRLKRAERFYRMWHYYLCVCSAASSARRFLLFQHLLVKPASGVVLEDPVR